MGGGNGGRRRSGKRDPTHGSVSTNRKPVGSGNRLSFLHQGSASKAGGSSKNEPRRLLNAFRYTYPDASTSASGDVEGPNSPIFLSSAGETIAAFVDRDPYLELAVGVPSCEDDPSVVPGAWLGYRADDGEDEEEEEAEVVESEGDEEMDGSDPYSTPVIKKDSFLMIGGVKVYTVDTSSPDEGDDGVSSNSDESKSSYSEEEEDDEEDEGSSDGSLDADSGSDVDEELAEDYLEGIGGSLEVLNVERLMAVKLDESDEDGLRRCDCRARGGGGDRLGGGALMNESKEYGMKRPSSRKNKSIMKPRKFGSTVIDIDVSGLDDLLFAKDSRTASGKKKKTQKQQPPYLSRSWPGEARKSRKYDNFPGAKKKHRKELIAAKRRQRMINRGVDLEQINKKLREMVINDVDMVSFQPMHSCDCSQVQRLASIYQLLSGRQGSGKKRFVTVTRTERTSLPSSKDRDRLDKLLGVGAEDEGFVVSSGNMIKLRTKAGRRFSSNPGSNPRVDAYQSAPSKLAKSSNASGKKKPAAKRQSYAEKPISFVSCGIMQVDYPTEMITVDSIESKAAVESAESSSSKLGVFEMHTKGFGSRMLAKMGFVEGGGLGKSGQGMVNPIEAIKRPKSLGLGIEFTETTSAEVKVEKAGGIGAFEKHTKGFGSRMMTKMGFIPGSGLGKDSQGIVTPLAAVRRPKCRGLGATRLPAYGH